MVFYPDLCHFTDLDFALIPTQMQDVSNTRGVERNEPIHLVDLFTTVVRAVSQDDGGFTFANDVSLLQHFGRRLENSTSGREFQLYVECSIHHTVAHNAV